VLSTAPMFREIDGPERFDQETILLFDAFLHLSAQFVPLDRHVLHLEAEMVNERQVLLLGCRQFFDSALEIVEPFTQDRVGNVILATWLGECVPSPPHLLAPGPASRRSGSSRSSPST
jgi:hypothetical protein